MRRLTLIICFTTPLACSNANQFLDHEANKEESKDPPTKDSTEEPQGEQGIDPPTWVNGSFLTCLWGELRSDEEVEVRCQLASKDNRLPPPSAVLECEAVGLVPGEVITSKIEQNLPLEVRILMPGNLVSKSKLQCNILGDATLPSDLVRELAFVDVLQELKNPDFVACLESSRGGETKACFTGANLSQCGRSLEDNCYSGVNAERLQASGVATTASGKQLTFVFANGTSGVKIWREAQGTRILGANGLDHWAKALNLNGVGLSETVFTDPGIETEATVIEGRECPVNVYIDDNNPVTLRNCLYYSPSYAAQVLNADGDDSGARLGFRDWSTLTWYRGNVKRCSDKRMRLPTLYETTSTAVSGGGLPKNWMPNAWGIGVPASTFTWTATGNNSDQRHFWTWSGSSSKVEGFDAYQGRAVRCVLPDQESAPQ